MAEQEPILTDAPTREMRAHVADYSRFIVMVKWTAIVSFVIGLIVIMFIL